MTNPRADGDPVILYTQDGCADTPAVQAWLEARGVAFQARNVSHDPEAVRALYATGTFATPLLMVGGRSVLGFRPAALAALLGG